MAKLFLFYELLCCFFKRKTTRSEFDSQEYQVRRRYNDFIWLRQRLEESHPTHLVPVSVLWSYSQSFNAHISVQISNLINYMYCYVFMYGLYVFYLGLEKLI